LGFTGSISSKYSISSVTNVVITSPLSFFSTLIYNPTFKSSWSRNYSNSLMSASLLPSKGMTLSSPLIFNIIVGSMTEDTLPLFNKLSINAGYCKLSVILSIMVGFSSSSPSSSFGTVYYVYSIYLSPF
jgi:hypothetical protein